MVRITLLAVLLFSLSGCLTGKSNYTQPAITPPSDNFVVVDKPIDTVWKTLVSRISERFFVINNLDRTSGLMNLSYSGPPDTYVDCGTISSFVSNLRGERTYTFSAASPHQIFESVGTDNMLYFHDRRMSLEGRINLLLQEATPTTTKITTNVRYIVTRTNVVRRADQPGTNTLTTTGNFNTGQSAELPGSTPAVVCRPTGRLERELLDLLK